VSGNSGISQNSGSNNVTADPGVDVSTLETERLRVVIVVVCGVEVGWRIRCQHKRI
jgi:hypothetical protein